MRHYVSSPWLLISASKSIIVFEICSNTNSHLSRVKVNSSNGFILRRELFYSMQHLPEIFSFLRHCVFKTLHLIVIRNTQMLKIIQHVSIYCLKLWVPVFGSTTEVLTYLCMVLLCLIAVISFNSFSKVVD